MTLEQEKLGSDTRRHFSLFRLARLAIWFSTGCVWNDGGVRGTQSPGHSAGSEDRKREREEVGRELLS